MIRLAVLVQVICRAIVLIFIVLYWDEAVLE